MPYALFRFSHSLYRLFFLIRCHFACKDAPLHLYIRRSVSRSVGNQMPVQKSELPQQLHQKGNHHVYEEKSELINKMNGMMNNHE